MALKAKHAFGSRENLDAAIKSGKIDAFDVLFLEDEGKAPVVGWLDKNGKPVLAEPDFSEVEADISDLESKVSAKADAEEVKTELAKKADATEVEKKIGQATQDTIDTAKAYTDGKVKAAIEEHLVKKYEITSKPVGTLVDYFDKEIRVMCPANTVWAKQNVGATGNANYYYMGFKAYAPEGAVSFKEGDNGIIEDKMFDFTDDFAGTDEYGRNFSIVWLPLASYDEASATWTYFGKNSSTDKYIGWTYVVEWYNADGIVIASDCIRINLSNENCHSSIEPYYINEIDAKIEKIEEKVEEVTTANEVVEF